MIDLDCNLNLQGLEKEVEIPRSVHGLVTKRLLVMNYLNGEQITRLKSRVQGMSASMQRRARQRILSRIADAYGLMIIGSGLFQADPHPGNIMVLAGDTLECCSFMYAKRRPMETTSPVTVDKWDDSIVLVHSLLSAHIHEYLIIQLNDR